MTLGEVLEAIDAAFLNQPDVARRLTRKNRKYLYKLLCSLVREMAILISQPEGPATVLKTAKGMLESVKRARETDSVPVKFVSGAYWGVCFWATELLKGQNDVDSLPADLFLSVRELGADLVSEQTLFSLALPPRQEVLLVKVRMEGWEIKIPRGLFPEHEVHKLKD